MFDRPIEIHRTPVSEIMLDKQRHPYLTLDNYSPRSQGNYDVNSHLRRFIEDNLLEFAESKRAPGEIFQTWAGEKTDANGKKVLVIFGKQTALSNLPRLSTELDLQTLGHITLGLNGDKFRFEPEEFSFLKQKNHPA